MKLSTHLAWVWGVWRQKKGLILLLLLLSLLSSLVAVSLPLLTKSLLDLLESAVTTAEKEGLETALAKAALYFSVLGIAAFIAGFFPGVRGAINNVFDYIIRKRYFSSVTEKDYRFFSAFSSPDIVTRLSSDINDFPKLAWFLCSGIFRAVESGSKILFCAVAMVLLDWRLALFSFLSLPLMLVIFSRVQSSIYDTVKKNEEAISSVNEQLELSFSGVRILKSFASEGKYDRFFADILKRRYETEMGVAKLDTFLNMFYQNINYAAQIALIFAGGLMVVRGRTGIGTFYAFYNYLNLLIYPMLDIPQLFIFGKRAFVNIDRLKAMEDFPAGDARAPGMRPQGPVAAEKAISGFDRLSIVDSSFRYPGREKPALDSVSLEIRQGEKLLVVGGVGSGKTTLLKTIAGLLPPEKGGVYIDDLPLKEILPSSWAALLGYVPQEPLLFSGSVRDNVAFGSPGLVPGIEDDELWSLLGTAQIDQEILAFPDRENTRIGQRGGGVSGGQKQRIAIARALARRPKLLLLDDMTASLDTKNEQALWKSLEPRSMTVVAVSHRLSSVQYVDKVLFLETGRVLGFGSHELLLRECPEYRDFIDCASFGGVGCNS
ncbi:MAG: ABC transporter ATP-binding protein [Spirochaetia bacterium]|jgi:ATP-binding cassette subfamily B protein|nr:ABC transporter ATP-binding protein [Spirochaetia bacterium]